MEILLIDMNEKYENPFDELPEALVEEMLYLYSSLQTELIDE